MVAHFLYDYDFNFTAKLKHNIQKEPIFRLNVLSSSMPCLYHKALTMVNNIVFAITTAKSFTIAIIEQKKGMVASLHCGVGLIQLNFFATAVS